MSSTASFSSGAGASSRSRSMISKWALAHIDFDVAEFPPSSSRAKASAEAANADSRKSSGN